MEKNESLIKTEKQKGTPFFVEAEKMFNKMAAFTEDTAARAYQYFLDRGESFGDQLDDWFKAEMETLRPATATITENKDVVHVTVAAPGFKNDEIEMTVKDNVLIVSGETSTEQKSESETTVLNEWRSDRFLRRLPMPCEVEPEGVDAVLKDGMLNVTLKKKTAVPAPKIAVKAA